MKIKNWAEEDRPREKLLEKGKKALTDSELIALLLGTGNKLESAVELSRKILTDVDNNLNQLSRLNIEELSKFKGIGVAKAVGIVAAMELGYRMKNTEIIKRFVITSSRHAFQVIGSLIANLSHEEFWVILLNRGNRVIEKVNISKGGVSGTVVDIKIVFKIALEKLASAIILCHNHPSGNLTPSEADKILTSRLKEAGKMMDIPVLDHLIVNESNYFSFADEGIL